MDSLNDYRTMSPDSEGGVGGFSDWKRMFGSRQI